jgi:hypothetical protein
VADGPHRGSRLAQQDLLAGSHAHPGAGGRAGARGGVGPSLASRVASLDRQTLLWLIPLTIAAAYLIVFVVQFPRNVTELAWDSDYSSGFTLPETLVRTGPGPHLLMGSAAAWVPLWFGLLTARLPLHRPLWEVMPTVLFVATALIVGWSVSRVATRRAALLAVLIGIVASPLALAFFMAPVAHNTLYPCTALLGAYLVWLAMGRAHRRLTAMGAPVLMGLILGPCLASDALLLATGVVPLALVAVLAGARRERHSRIVSVSALATIAIAVPIAALTSSIMTSLGYLKENTPAQIAPLSELPERGRLLFKGLKALFNGYLGPEKPGLLHAPLGIASDIVMVAALVTLLVLGVRSVARLISTGLRKDRPQEPTQLARSMHIAYWTISAACACGAFWLAAETGGGTNLHESYYGTVIFSVAAVIPLLLSARTPARWLLPAGASIFFAASLAGLTSNYLNISAWIARDAPSITKIAEENHVTAGYGGYGEASSLTWNTDGHLTVRPLMECPGPEGVTICPFYLVAPSSWYVPRRRDTFLLVDSEEPWLRSLPPGLGEPLASYAIGAMRMYIYPYDIASRLGSTPA